MFGQVLNTPLGFPQNSYSDTSDKIWRWNYRKIAICSPFHEKSITTIFQYFKTFSKVPFPIPLWTIIVKLVTFHKKKQMTLLILYYLSGKYIQKCKTWLYIILIHFFTFNHNDKESIHCHITARHFPIKESYILFKGVWGLRLLP